MKKQRLKTTTNNSKKLQYLVGIYSIVVGFAHFPTISSINEAVREYSSR